MNAAAGEKAPGGEKGNNTRYHWFGNQMRKCEALTCAPVVWPCCGEEAHFMCVRTCVIDRQTVSMYREREMCVMFGLPSTAPLIDPFRATYVLLNYCPLLVGSPVLSPEVCKQTWLSEKHSAHISCYPVREIRQNKKGLIISPLLSAMAGRSQTFSRQIALTPQWTPCIYVCVCSYLDWELACVMQMEMEVGLLSKVKTDLQEKSF